MQACNNPALGSAGINCIKDRQRGGKYDFFAMFYDPIATDPAPAANALAAAQAAAAAPATTAASSANPIDSAVSSITASTGLSPMVLGLLLIGGALLMVGD